jgi:hypothetical protein
VTPGLGSGEYAYNGTFLWDSKSWQNSFSYEEVGENFNPEAGFLERKAYRSVRARVTHIYRPKDSLRLLELRPNIEASEYWNLQGFKETGRVHACNMWVFRNGARIHAGANFNHEGLLEPFEIYPGVIVLPGSYDHKQGTITVASNRGAPFSFGFGATVGGFFGGDTVALSPQVQFRTGETFNTSVSLSRNDIKLPGGKFVTNLVQWRVAYNFSPRLFVQSLLQYNDRANIWSTNLRLGWLQRANSGLFIVYNDTRGLGDFLDRSVGRSLTLKFSRMFDVLN